MYWACPSRYTDQDNHKLRPTIHRSDSVKRAQREAGAGRGKGVARGGAGRFSEQGEAPEAGGDCLSCIMDIKENWDRRMIQDGSKTSILTSITVTCRVIADFSYLLRNLRYQPEDYIKASSEQTIPRASQCMVLCIPMGITFDGPWPAEVLQACTLAPEMLTKY
jgi:hypothetical protein